MVRFKRTVFTNPSIDNAKMIHFDESRVEHSMSYVLEPTDVKEKYGLYNVQTPRERFSRKDLLYKDDSAGQKNYNFFDSSNLTFPLPTKETYFRKPKRHVQYEKLSPGNTTKPQFINHTGADDFERAIIESNRQSRHLKMNFVNESDIFEMDGPIIQNKTVKRVTGKRRGEGDNSDSIQGLEKINKMPNPFRFKSHGNKIINRLSHERFPMTETAMKRVNVDDNLSLLTGIKISNESLYKRNHKLLPITNDIISEKWESFRNEKLVFGDNKGERIHDIPKTEDFNSPETWQARTEPDYINFAETPLRLLQRPTRAKRMRLHKPELVVIPEIGGIFQKSKNMDFARMDMLLSESSFSRNSVYHPNRKVEREENSEVKSRINFQNKMKLDNKLLSSISSSDLMHLKGHAQYPSCYADMSRLANNRLLSVLPREKSDNITKWSRYSLLDNEHQSYRDNEDHKMKSMISAHNHFGYYYN